jgi:hypothetical protein
MFQLRNATISLRLKTPPSLKGPGDVMVLFRTSRNENLLDALSMECPLRIARRPLINHLIGDQIEFVLPNPKLLLSNEKVQAFQPLARRTERKPGV